MKFDSKRKSFDFGWMRFACSMGGSVAIHVAAKKMLPSLAGLVVVDVVEVLKLWLKLLLSKFKP